MIVNRSSSHPCITTIVRGTLRKASKLACRYKSQTSYAHPHKLHFFKVNIFFNKIKSFNPERTLTHREKHTNLFIYILGQLACYFQFLSFSDTEKWELTDLPGMQYLAWCQWLLNNIVTHSPVPEQIELAYSVLSWQIFHVALRYLYEFLEVF